MTLEVAAQAHEEQNPVINKGEFIRRVARRAKMPRRVVKEVYAAVFEELTECMVAGEPVVLTGFGRFESRLHGGHRVRFGHPPLDPYLTARFNASVPLKRRLREGGVHPEVISQRDQSAEPDTEELAEAEC